MSVSACDNKLKKMVPLLRVVSAAAMDTYDDYGRFQQSGMHWAARGLKKITRETLKTGRRKILLEVNNSTGTATLPPDFDDKIFVGLINENGCKIELRENHRLVDHKNIEEECCEDRCPKCNQDKQICQDLTITEEIILVQVNGITAQQTFIKKMYPDGSYWLETIIPVWDIASNGIAYQTTKELISCIDLKACGCVEETTENIEIIKSCAPEVYACYFAQCDCDCDTDYGGYKIFPETGLIYFDHPNLFDRAYMEYRGFLTKINGQYYVPEVAFETLIEYVKYKKIRNKKGVPQWEREQGLMDYRRERDNMNKVLGQVSLSLIIDSVGLYPIFDLYANPSDVICDPCASLSNCLKL